jgi:D-alanyl-lipoteichoic acid acyltransferase DltB (MBOAT superfamily)
LIGLFVLAAVFFLFPAGRSRQIVLALCNAGFLILFVPDSATWIALALFVLSGYYAAKTARRIAGTRTYSPFLAGYITLVLATFLILKKYRFLQPILPHQIFGLNLAIVGLSYMLFRQIHFVVDVAEDQIQQVSLWDYLNYQFNLFGLLAGPIQRYQEFHESWSSLRPLVGSWRDQLGTNARLFAGVVKLSLVAPLFLHWADSVSSRQLYAGQLGDLAKFAVLFYAYPVYIYFNFSGYCDIVIAGAALVGMRLPENFNRPYFARNMIDYWTRWHMSLTNWIRDYLFTPLYKNGVERWPNRMKGITYACYFIALTIVGVWHGSSWNFVVFGLLNGVGVTATKIWEQAIIRRRGRAGLREYLKSRPIHAVAWVMTMNFVCLTLLFFPTNLRERARFLYRFAFEKPAVSAELVR